MCKNTFKNCYNQLITDDNQLGEIYFMSIDPLLCHQRNPSQLGYFPSIESLSDQKGHGQSCQFRMCYRVVTFAP